MESDEPPDERPREFATRLPKTDGLPQHANNGKVTRSSPYGDEYSEERAVRLFDSDYELSANANRERVKRALDDPASLTAEILIDRLEGRAIPPGALPPEALHALHHILLDTTHGSHPLALTVLFGTHADDLRTRLRHHDAGVRESAEQIIVEKRLELKTHMQVGLNGAHIKEKAFRSGIKKPHGRSKPAARDLAKKYSRPE